MNKIFIIMLIFVGSMVFSSCDMNHPKLTKIEQCAYDCHVLYNLDKDTLINCMTKCEKKYLHTEQ